MLQRNSIIEALDMVLAQDVPDYVLPEAVASQAALLDGRRSD